MSYNGWSNQETYIADLWLSNDFEMYTFMEELAEEVQGEKYPVNKMGDILQKEFKKNMPNLSGLYGDLLSNALDNVNFREICDSFLEDYE